MMSAQSCSGPTRYAQGAKWKKKEGDPGGRGKDAAFGVLVCFNLSPSNLLLGSSRTTKAAAEPNILTTRSHVPFAA